MTKELERREKGGKKRVLLAMSSLIDNYYNCDTEYDGHESNNC